EVQLWGSRGAVKRTRIQVGRVTSGRHSRICNGGPGSMAFNRSLQRGDLDAEALTSAMAGIGMAFAADATQHPPIEETLVSASEEGMLRDDLRVLSVLVTWLEVHRERINVDRLTRLVQSIEEPRV